MNRINRIRTNARPSFWAVRGGVSLLAAISLASPALAQSNDAPGTQDDVLRGPPVEDNSLPGQRGKFGGNQSNKNGQRAGDTMNLGLLTRALGVLRQESTPASARLTDQQEQSIRQVAKEHRELVRAYYEQHQSEIKTLRTKVGPEARKKIDQNLRGLPGGPGDRRNQPGQPPLGRPERKDSQKPAPASDDMNGDPMTPIDPKEEAVAIERLREILQGAPKAQEAYSRGWAVLSAEQKPLVEKELERLRAEGRRPNPKGEPMGKPDGMEQSGDDAVDLSKLPPRVRERLEKLTPEQRAKAIERLKQRQKSSKNSEGDAVKDDAPSMEDVDVPEPTKETPADGQDDSPRR